MIRALLAAAALLVPLAAAADESPLFAIYRQYSVAIEDGDLAAAKKHLSAGKLKAIESMSEPDALAAIETLSPKDALKLHKEIVDGDDATLVVRAKVAETDSAGHIQFVREDGKWKILSELWDIGGDPDSPPGDPVPQPKNDEQRAAIRKLRERGFAAPSPEFLVMSAVSGDLEALKLFVAAGYSPDATGQGSPAIVGAAMAGHGEIVKYLIEIGANVNAQDEVHTTALMRLADKCDHTDVVRALLAAGAATDVQSDGGSTALQLAEWSNCTENAEAIRAKM